MSQPQAKVEFPSYERPNTDVSTLMLLLVAVAIEGTILILAYFSKGTFFRDLLMGRHHIEMSVSSSRAPPCWPSRSPSPTSF